ncbi:DUF58 domain-containing protein [uncultured Pseudoteredinibacter sp.]|uniref:DUF58 domain-containing protein n=1 Tax=uncultured Pseudoteredinibacter sp. TaxID=1641701 RepID=UPI002638E8FB|nr:DUF58 domain-containing protein [uncultured Pseudoteredinibacter sp.]
MAIGNPNSPASKKLLEAGIQVDMEALIQQAAPSKSLMPLFLEGLLGPLLGHRSGSRKGSGLDFAELNHYQQGDDIRHVDWKLSSRKQSPYVRHYQEEKEQRFELLVDQGTSMLFGSLADSKAAVAAKLAAQIGWQAIHQGDPCSCSVVSSSETHWGHSSRSLQSWLQTLSDLQEINQNINARAEASDQLLSSCLEEMLDRRYRGRHIYIISDFMSLLAQEQNVRLQQQLQALSQHNSLRLIYIFDELERRFPEAGFLPISDGHHHAEINSSDPDLQLALQRTFLQRLHFLSDVASTLPNVQLLVFDCSLQYRGELL